MVVGMRVFLILALIAITLAEDQLENPRKKKVLSLFSVVTFPNDQCTAKSSTTATPVLGTCLSQTECSGKSGTVDGNCASGFGVCCTFLVSSCGSTVSENCTYIQNPSYPASYSTTGDCSYTVNPLSSDICQLRLDLDNLDIVNAIPGACTDSFQLTAGSGRSYDSLCGTLTGHHLYMETGRKTSGQTLKFTIGTGGGGTWRFKVSHIECWSTSKAPTDCLQYFTGTSGVVESFNFPTQLIATNQYTVCIRQEPGYCGIEWSELYQTSNTQIAANVILADAFDLDATLTVSAHGYGDIGAVDAYVLIPGSKYSLYGGTTLSEDEDGTAANQDLVPSSVQAYGQPFHLRVNTFGALADTAGFKLSYTQLACGNSIAVAA